MVLWKKVLIGLMGACIVGVGLFYSYSYLKHQQQESKYKNLLLCSKLQQLETNETFKALVAREETQEFYQKSCQKTKMLPWFDENLLLSSQSAGVLQAIQEGSKHGLYSQKYHLNELEQAINIYKNTTQFPSLDVQANQANKIDALLSDAYLAFFNDSYYGITDWKKFKNLQHIYAKQEAVRLQEEKRAKLIEMNMTMVEDDEVKVRKFEWSKPAKKGLKPVDELLVNLSSNNIYASLSALHPKHNEYKRLMKLWIQAKNQGNITLAKKILANMERHRWLNVNYDNESLAVSVNIPAFRLSVLEHGDEVWNMRVIVGKPQRPTPILESSFSNAILNPYWTAPQTVILEDMLKKANTMASYLESHNMKVFLKTDGGKREINPADVNWSIYKGKKNIPYVFRAEPGKDNPLGAIKFTFANPYSVYMHDTDKKKYFAEDMRAFSSGCVRLHEPVKLFSYILGKNEDVNLTNYNKSGKPEYAVSLHKDVPVVFWYMTVRVDKGMNMQVFDDVYGYDETHINALKDIDKIL